MLALDIPDGIWPSPHIVRSNLVADVPEATQMQNFRGVKEPLETGHAMQGSQSQPRLWSTGQRAVASRNALITPRSRTKLIRSNRN